MAKVVSRKITLHVDNLPRNMHLMEVAAFVRGALGVVSNAAHIRRQIPNGLNVTRVRFGTWEYIYPDSGENDNG